METVDPFESVHSLLVSGGRLNVCSALADLALPGDLNLDGQVNLEDAVLGLQILSGLNPDGMDRMADRNGDKRIGLPEIIYMLKRLSEDPKQSN